MTKTFDNIKPLSLLKTSSPRADPLARLELVVTLRLPDVTSVGTDLLLFLAYSRYLRPFKFGLNILVSLRFLGK